MMESSPTAEATDVIDLKHYWFVFKRRWLPATTVFVSVLGLAVAATFLQKPIYQATGKIKLSDNKSASLASLQDLQGAQDALGSLKALTQQSNPLDTEAEEIRSDPIIQSTIAALQLKNNQGEPLEPEEFLENISIVNAKGTDVLQLSYESTDPKEAEAVINQIMNFYFSVNRSTNRAEAKAAREFLENQLPMVEAKVLKAEAALRKFEEKNKILNLREEAKASVGVIANLQGRINETEANIAHLNTQSGMLRNKLGMSLEKDMAKSALSQSPAVQKTLGEYHQVEDQLAVARTQFQETHPKVIDLKDKEAAIKAQLQGRVGRVLEGQRLAPNQNLQTGESRQKLTEEFVKLELERSGLVKGRAALSNQQSTYKQRANILPKLQQGQRALERNLTVAQSTYETIFKNLQAARLAENQNIGNARLMQAARTQTDPVAPRKVLNLAIGTLFGLILAGATALILEAMDISIKTAREARELLGYTLLGTIPYLKGSEKVARIEELNRHRLWDIIPVLGRSKKESQPEEAARPVPAVAVRDNPRSYISEAYRKLQANLKFLNSDKLLKVIVVTSSVPQEGKSTVSANTAMAMAQMGHRVLLVDADMRRPSQHRIWKLPNLVGLSNVISGQTHFRTKRVIREASQNLDLMTSGAMPPNPLALLDSKTMASLIESLSEIYDYVIIDTPPLAAAADALTLGKMADGVLLVARPGVVDSTSAVLAKEALEQSGQNVLGLAVNGAIPENESGGYYQYYHYAGNYYNTVAEESSEIEKSVL